MFCCCAVRTWKFFVEGSLDVAFVSQWRKLFLKSMSNHLSFAVGLCYSLLLVNRSHASEQSWYNLVIIAKARTIFGESFYFLGGAGGGCAAIPMLRFGTTTNPKPHAPPPVRASKR